MMKRTLSKAKCIYITALVLLTVLGTTALPYPVSAQPPDARYFPETQHSVSGLFLTYWDQNGGLAQQGYPLSDELQEASATDGKIYKIQYFERAVFELHPENAGTPYEVLLQLLGVFYYQQNYSVGAPNQQPNNDTGSILFHETGKRLGGKFLSYWQTHGAVAQQGFPISDEFREVSPLDGKTYTVQYFERAVFELHPENAGTPYEVLLSQLGTFRLQKNDESPATPTITATAVPPTMTPTAVPTADIPPEATNWLIQNSIQLRTTEPDGVDFDDMTPLKDIIGDAHIVSMGEASHGAHEFFTMKSRTFQFLVQEMGFTVIAIENGFDEVEAVNTYVHGGDLTAEEAVSELGPFTGQNQETVDLIKWMRQFNQNRKDAPAISFRGFDMQEATLPISNVVAYLQKVDPAATESARTQYSCFASPFSYSTKTEDRKAACRAGISQVHETLVQNRVMYETMSSGQEFANAEHDARVLMQSEDYFSTYGTATSSKKRDQYMAENAIWIKDQAGPNAKVMLWAHNGHVETVSYNNITSMGQYLRQQYGDDMRVFGFDFFKGSFNAQGVVGDQLGPIVTHTISASQPGSYASYFHSTNIPVMAVDLRHIQPDNSASNWLIGPRAIWGIGGAFNDADPYSASGDINLAQAFDVLIYVDTITPSQLLP